MFLVCRNFMMNITNTHRRITSTLWPRFRAACDSNFCTKPSIYVSSPLLFHRTVEPVALWRFRSVESPILFGAAFSFPPNCARSSIWILSRLFSFPCQESALDFARSLYHCHPLPPPRRLLRISRRSWSFSSKAWDLWLVDPRVVNCAWTNYRWYNM